MSLRQGLGWYYEVCGIRGICAIASYRFCGRPRELTLVPPKSRYPVHLRIDTSDFCAYKDVLTFQSKSYDPQIPDFAPKIIVDVGAHIGMASILFARKYPAARIIAIEPEVANFTALVRNTSLYKTITPIQAALWRKDGEVTLGASNAHPKGAFHVVEKGPQRVRAITMERLMHEAGIDSIDLLKIDIEGAEIEVFELCPWIHSVAAVAIELHDRIRPGCSAAVGHALRDFHRQERGEVTFFVCQASVGARDYSADPSAGRLIPARFPAA